jgi:PatG C-terminal
MEQTTETSIVQPGSATNAPSVVPSQENNGGSMAPPPCSTCAGAPASQTRSYVYAVGRIEPRFPSPAVEKEFAQASGRAETKGKTDRETLQAVLSARENRYLARQVCYVLTVQGLETYIVTPRDSADFDLLVEAVRAVPRPSDLDVVIGVLGPIAPPEMCNGLMVPIVAFDQVYSFDRDALIKAIPRPDKVAAKESGPAAEELFDRIMQMTDNAGATDENRALNYLAVRYPAIYATAAESFGRNYSLTALDVRLSSLSSVRKIVDCIWSFTHRQYDVTERFFCRVDVTEEFPFLVTKMSPYYDRQT